jgi:hypothetical protein
MTLESMARERAEQKVPQLPVEQGLGYIELDPRFAALRGEHEWQFQFSEGERQRDVCSRCGKEFRYPDELNPYCLRTNLGAIVRAAAACDLSLRLQMSKYRNTDKWFCVWRRVGQPHMDKTTMADTPEEAAMRALYEATA